MKYKLNNVTFSIMFGILINSTLLGILTPFLINNTKSSVLISLFISFILGFIFLLLFFKIFNYLPDKNIIEKIDYLFPKSISKLINFIILIIVYLFLIIIFYRISAFIETEFLPEVPSFITPIMLSLPIIYFSCFDINTAGRVGIISFIISIIMYLINIFCLFNNLDFNNFLPLFSTNILNISKYSLIYIIVYLTPLFLILLIPKSNIINNDKTNKYLLISYIISFICSSLIMFVIMGVLGYNVSSLYKYPSYAVLKTMSVFSFLDNLENLNILILVLFMSYTCGFSLLFIKSLASYLTNKKKNFINIILSSLIIILLSITIYTISYETYLTKLHINYTYIILVISIMYILIVLLCLLKRKRSLTKTN